MFGVKLLENAEHWKLVAESSEFHLMLSRVEFFQNKRDILRENRDGVKKAVMLTPMEIIKKIHTLVFIHIDNDNIFSWHTRHF